MAQANSKQLSMNVKRLQNDVGMLRSLLISFLGKDKEGSYKPKFVRDIFKAVKERPAFSFRDSDSFLSQIEEA